MDDLIPLLRKYVDQNSDVCTLEWDKNVSIPLLFDPMDKSPEGQRRTAHYFLLVASITESKLIGTSENARTLMVDLHRFLGDDLFTTKDSSLLDEIVKKYAYYRQLGLEKDLIPETLVSVNFFIDKFLEKDLAKYSKNFNHPSELVDDLQLHIPRMGGRYSEKSWMYLRWMTRPSDLGIFTHLSTSNLSIPLTSYLLDVAEYIGIDTYPRRELWDNPVKVNETRNKFTDYAKQIYPDDPTKVDYPFYMLGRWLRGKTKNRRVLKQHLEFLVDIYEQTGQPPVKYNIVIRDMSSYEKRVKEALEALDVVYHYESNIFRLTEGAPTYKPDFILPDYQRSGKTILLEPHGMWTPPRRNRVRIGSRWMEVTAPGEPSVDEREFIEKLTIFRQLYGHSFYLILLIPPMHYKYVETQYPEAYDELRLIDEVPRVLHDIHKYHI